MRTILLLACATLSTASCGGPKNKKTEPAATVASPAADYDFPQVPLTLTDPEAQARWAAEHYWDNFDFADTTSVEGWSNYATQAFVNFDYHLLRNIPRPIASDAIAELFRRAAIDKAVFGKFAEIAEQYLFDPNSPYRDEELYIATLDAVLANPALDQWERVRPAEQLRMALKNRVGTPAADFRYTLGNGATGTLYAFKAAYTLLFINNPGCPACRETMSQITGSAYLSRLIEEGTLGVLAIYPDEDLAAWREYAPNFPKEWVNSYDAGATIKNDELYDLKAIPTIYLLDGAKRVMLKDEMSIPQIEETIKNDLQ